MSGSPRLCSCPNGYGFICSRGLRGLELNQWWITFVEQHLLRQMATAMRQAYGLPTPEKSPIGVEELELYWLFHGGIFYFGQRREVYGHLSGVSLTTFIANSVNALVDGLPVTLARLLKDKPARIDRKRAAPR